MTAKKASAKEEKPVLWEFTGPQEVYYPAYGYLGEDGEVVPLQAKPGMDPVEIVPGGSVEGLPMPPDGNWVDSSGKMGVDKDDKPDNGGN